MDVIEEPFSVNTESVEEVVRAVVEREINTQDNPPLPANSPTISLEDETARFSSAEWFDIIRGMYITIAGLGGIGSFVNFLVSRMKPKGITLYDDDKVETVNMSGQLYGSNHMGMFKTFASADIGKYFAKYYSYCTSEERVIFNTRVTDILICGFDNMTGRKQAFKAWLEHIKDYDKESKKQCLFIDGRLSAEFLQIFCMTGNDDFLIKKYQEKWLFSDKEAEETVCSYKQTSYCANLIGSLIANLLVNFATNLGNPIIQRELPFMTTYDASMMLLKTERV